MTQKNRIYGYCRVSTKSQSLERQERNILARYPTAKVAKEAFTGTTMNRPQWLKLMAKVQPGDTIVFDSVSRMSRNSGEGVKNYMDLYEMGVNLVFLKEPHINSEVYRKAMSKHIDISVNTGRKAIDKYMVGQNNLLNELMMDLAAEQISLAFDQAQKEVDDKRQNTKEGIETARRNGKQIGQKEGAKLHSKTAAKAKAVILEHSKSFGGHLNDADCMKLAECSRNSFYLYKRELKDLYSRWGDETAEDNAEEWRESLSPEDLAIVEKWDNEFPL